MRRFKRDHIISTDPNRWMASYADFITLLFAFFVVLYAVSSVNERKYKSLSSSLQHVFSKQKEKMDSIPQQASNTNIGDGSQKGDGDNVAKLSDKLNSLSAGFLNVHKDKNWIELEIKSNALFESGKARPSQKALAELEKLAKILKTTQSPIAIEGYTDDRPINTPQFPSNWELSAARSAAVARVLMKNGINGNRLSATGFGEQYPVASNLDEGGRAKNRRVILVIANDQSVARLLNPGMSSSVKYLAQKKKAQSLLKPAMKEQRLNTGGLKFTRTLKKQEDKKKATPPPKQENGI